MGEEIAQRKGKGDSMQVYLLKRKERLRKNTTGKVKVYKGIDGKESKI